MKALPAHAHRQRGVILIMYAVLITAILGFAGFVLDLGLVYLRRAQLQAAADNLAVSAAVRLKSKKETFMQIREEIKADIRVIAKRAAIGDDPDQLLDLLSFSNDPNLRESSWTSLGSLDYASLRSMVYVRVDMGRLEASRRQTQPLLSTLLGRMEPFDVRPMAMAAYQSLNVMPLAICAFNDNSRMKQDTRESAGGKVPIKELVPYGFRQGVTYNLLKLNPKGSNPLYYFVDPLSGPDGASATANLTDDIMAPFMCSGTVAYPRIGNGRLKLSRRTTFGMAQQINSRLDIYGPGESARSCTPSGAPPDTNIISFVNTNVPWARDKTTNASASSANVNGALKTVADRPWIELSTKPPAPGEYGTLWAFRSPRNVDGGVVTDSWHMLYPTTRSDQFNSNQWNDKAPYFADGTRYKQAPNPDRPGRKWRRLMPIPLLACDPDNPPATEAAVLAYGLFYLTAPATDTELPGEFGGFLPLADESKLRGDVELQR